MPSYWGLIIASSSHDRPGAEHKFAFSTSDIVNIFWRGHLKRHWGTESAEVATRLRASGKIRKPSLGYR